MKAFLLKFKVYFLYAGLFSLFINILQLTFSIYMLLIYDRVLVSHSIPTLLGISVAAVLALSVLASLDFLRSKLLYGLGMALESGLNKKVLSKLMNVYARPVDNRPEASIKDVGMLRAFFGGPGITAIFDIPWTPIYLYIIYMLHPDLGLAATFGAVIIFILGLINEYRTRKLISKAQDVTITNSKFVGSMLANTQLIKSMGMSENMAHRWRALQNNILALNYDATTKGGILQSITKSFRISMQVIIYGVGAYLTIKQETTAGCMIAASIITGRALQPIEMAMGSWRQFVNARDAFNRLDKLMAAKDPEVYTDCPEPVGELNIKDLSFENNGKQILQDISFDVKPGEMLGIIGPSAAGKSTLCKFLVGVWKPTAGEILLDGLDMHKWDEDELGKYVGYVPQNITIFPGSISSNIARLGKIDSEKVIEAAKIANVHHMILNLPNGYDTQYMQGGYGLSGGQQQRLALARAIYGSPKLLVLDEPYSNLDDEGEKALINALINMKQRGTTIVVVSHKINILAPADKVLVMQQGKNVLFGPKDAVLQKLFGQQQKPAPQKPKQQQQPQNKPVTITY